MGKESPVSAEVTRAFNKALTETLNQQKWVEDWNRQQMIALSKTLKALNIWPQVEPLARPRGRPIWHQPPQRCLGRGVERPSRSRIHTIALGLAIATLLAFVVVSGRTFVPILLLIVQAVDLEHGQLPVAFEEGVLDKP